MKKMFLLLTLIIGALAVSAFSVPEAQAQAAPQRIVITARRFSYSPGEITLKKGRPVVLVLKSTDVAHGLHFSDFNLNVKVNAGGTAEVEFTPDKTGEYVGHCSVFCGSGHGSMSLKLHVID